MLGVLGSSVVLSLLGGRSDIQVPVGVLIAAYDHESGSSSGKVRMQGVGSVGFRASGVCVRIGIIVAGTPSLKCCHDDYEHGFLLQDHYT